MSLAAVVPLYIVVYYDVAGPQWITFLMGAVASANGFLVMANINQVISNLVDFWKLITKQEEKYGRH
jgi:hypothetical protein